MKQSDLFSRQTLPAQAERKVRALSETDILREARVIYEKRMKTVDAIENPQAAIEFLKLSLSDRDREVFAVLHLNTRHHVIEYEELFRGTIDGCVVHPREVVRSALLKNTTAMIVCHNHPSGISEPSEADFALTARFSEVLALVDIRLLDHVIVGGDATVSLSQWGLM